MDGGRSWRQGILIAAITFAVTLLYAYVRYSVIRDVPLSDLPLFIANKSVALGSVVLIGISLALGPMAKLFPSSVSPHLPLRKSLGLIGFGAAAVHALMSLVLLSPTYYAKFYAESGALTLAGQSSLLFGILALVVFTLVALSSLPLMYERLGEARWRSMQRLGYGALALTLLHVVVMGAPGWINPAAYSYGFISISLLSAFIIVAVFVVRLAAYARRSTGCD